MALNAWFWKLEVWSQGDGGASRREELSFIFLAGGGPRQAMLPLGLELQHCSVVSFSLLRTLSLAFRSVIRYDLILTDVSGDPASR